MAHHQYELMGMINMALLHNRLPPEPLAQGGEFWDRVGGAPGGDVASAVAERDTASPGAISQI